MLNACHNAVKKHLHLGDYRFKLLASYFCGDNAMSGLFEKRRSPGQKHSTRLYVKLCTSCMFCFVGSGLTQ